MARFRATIKGQRGEASRLGNGKTGMSARVNGWHSGVRVEAEGTDTGDRFWLYATGGSTGAHTDKPLGYVKLDKNGEPSFYTYRDIMKDGDKAHPTHMGLRHAV